MGVTRAKEAEQAQTLGELVRDFRKRLGPEGPMEHGYLEWMRESPDIGIAIDRAVRSRMPNGVMHNHQTRVPIQVLLRYGIHLRSQIGERSEEDFHWLWIDCKRAAIAGIGPVTVYDVATRIGAYLGLEPDRVYLHAGVKQGAEALGIDTRGREYLQSSDLPVALRSLTANETEDFLCVYRSLFPAIRKGGIRY